MTVAVIDLPASPTYVTGSPRLLSFATDQRSSLGGATQRLARLGSRFAIDVQYPPMAYSDAQSFLAALVQSEMVALSIPVPQRGLSIGAPGAPVVNGGGQGGLQLSIRGAAAGYTVQLGQFLSITSGGRRSLYMCAASTLLNGSGAGAIPIAPMLRTTPSDGDAVELAAPRLEGFLPIGAVKWSIEMLIRIGIAFSVEEDR